MGSLQAAAFGRSIALLRRGLVSGGDVSELLGHFETFSECVGLSLASGYRFASGEGLRNIDPSWPRVYAPYAAYDPARRYLDDAGPFGVYSVSRTADAAEWRRSPLLDVFGKAGFCDVAILRVAGPADAVFAVYRPRELGPFSELALERMSALVPHLELAMASTVAASALAAPRDEAHGAALDRLRAWAVVPLNCDQASSYSPAALKVLRASLDGFGARGQARLERVLRAAHRRFLERHGGRVVVLKRDLTAELALLPRSGHDASLLVVFHALGRAPERVPPFAELLSPTQRVVARRIAGGSTVAAVAGELGVSPDAVKKHLAEVYRRLGVGSRAELASMFFMQ